MRSIDAKKKYTFFSLLSIAKQVAKDIPSVKFERMQMLPSTNSTHDSTVPAINTTTPMNLNSIWRIRNQNNRNIPILNEECSVNTTSAENACHLFEVCISNLTMLIEEVEAKLQHKSENMNVNYTSVRLSHTWYEFITVQVAFFGGLFIGTIFGTIMLFTLKLISDCVMISDTAENEHRMRRRRRMYNIHCIS